MTVTPYLGAPRRKLAGNPKFFRKIPLPRVRSDGMNRSKALSSNGLKQLLPASAEGAVPLSLPPVWPGDCIRPLPPVLEVGVTA